MAKYNRSYQANSACKEAIEQTISAHYAENRLDTEALLFAQRAEGCKEREKKEEKDIDKRGVV